MEDKRLKINDRVVCRLKFHLISRKKTHTHTRRNQLLQPFSIRFSSKMSLALAVKWYGLFI